jgi:lysophospholipase L1-like esterase
LSPTIQLRYLEAHPDSTPWVYDGPVRYANPNKEITNLGLTVKADSLGYRNPQQLLEENPEIDVLLLGDSFVWGTEDRTIADYLRDFLDPLTIYSSAVSGSGIPQWRYHYQRFIDSNITSTPPDVVVLNFYSGNDLDDTTTFLALDERYYDSAKYYFTYNKHQYLLATANRPFGLPKLPEIIFITSSIIDQMQGSEQQTVQIGDEQVEVKLGEHEPHPGRFNEDILNALSEVTTTIKETSPETIIVLTYIPTGYGLYGGRTSDCPGCDYEIDFQMENSQILQSYAHELNIEYADFSSQLREQSQITPMWSLNDHLSAQGYELYSQLLAEKINFLLTLPPPS